MAFGGEAAHLVRIERVEALDALALAEPDQRVQIALIARDGMRREPALRLQALKEIRELSMKHAARARRPMRRIGARRDARGSPCAGPDGNDPDRGCR